MSFYYCLTYFLIYIRLELFHNSNNQFIHMTNYKNELQAKRTSKNYCYYLLIIFQKIGVLFI